jgi:hypothetical protein
MHLYITLALGLLLLGCHHSQDYRIVSFANDPTVHDPVMQTLGQEFVLEHNGVRIVAHCWLSEHESVDTGCPELESRVGQAVVLDYWKLGDKTMSNVLVYKPDGQQQEEMLRVDSARAE